jgi:prephenate dehydrogenase
MSRTPQEALHRQQSTLRTLITKLTMIADDQVDSIDIENATWADVAAFAMQAEMAEEMINTLAESYVEKGRP